MYPIHHMMYPYPSYDVPLSIICCTLSIIRWRNWNANIVSSSIISNSNAKKLLSYDLNKYITLMFLIFCQKVSFQTSICLWLCLEYRLWYSFHHSVCCVQWWVWGKAFNIVSFLSMIKQCQCWLITGLSLDYMLKLFFRKYRGFVNVNVGMQVSLI